MYMYMYMHIHTYIIERIESQYGILGEIDTFEF